MLDGKGIKYLIKSYTSSRRLELAVLLLKAMKSKGDTVMEVRTYIEQEMIEVIVCKECDKFLEEYIGSIKVKESCNILRLSEVYGV